MTAKKNAKKSPVVITAPKIVTAWQGVCETSTKSQADIVKSIANLEKAMTTQSKLSVRDLQKVITETKLTSAFVSYSQVSGLPTWKKMYDTFEDFRALPISKQLATACASYSILGAGVGESMPTLEAVKKEVATIRKAKYDAKKKQGAGTSKESKEKKSKNILADILEFFISADMSKFSEAELDTVAEIHATIESKVELMDDAEVNA